ncbi:sigma-70 family RNA polymerase sigma factor [Paenibacillus dokdonensis]|uniref:Sigma-70 family RNA polymerase sigma factor n=1 Tax=Paenibacillus dokdonensis TaxID=2567944 RepID=A0ABU6GR69_9BACL|nr:sigma-70 family RNA polymerase sigma factor [Paenibacillus dokdonensis]MEC0242237.1 sigma-70 family RNA polymerase sigma factor [Paenibacillus dokdonensis]
MDTHKLTEEEARAIYKEHSPYVYGIALMMTRSAPMADDIMQDTFLRAFQKYHTYDSARPLRPWLYRITVNLIKSLKRKQRWLFFQAQLPEKEDDRLVEDCILKNESERELWASVNELSAKRREVIILHYYAGLSLPEVAVILRIPEGTCKSRLHEALKQLRGSETIRIAGVSCKEDIR